jgi:polyhydroxyalkanoate synthase
VNIEAFSKNLARMIEGGGQALAAYLRPREEGKIEPGPADEIADMIKTLGQVLEYWLSDPARAVELQSRLGHAYLELFGSAARRMSGEEFQPVVRADPKDKRFADPEWTSNHFFDFVKQAYLVSTGWAETLVADAKGLDPHTRHKAEFYVRQLTNALSPSNFVLTNPELLRETLTTNAGTLARGMRMLAEDIKAGDGDLKIRQSDAEKFEVGKNLACSPGKVIFENKLMQLIQYAPSTPSVLKTPLLICPPWINKFYVLDLNPQKSFIRWVVGEGHSVFVISWVNPDRRHAEKDWGAYIEEGIKFALEAIEKATGEREVNAIGYCVGGTLLAATLALHAKEKNKRIRSATLFTTQVDFTHAGDLKVFVDEEQLTRLENYMNVTGYLDGSKMATAFNMLRASELIWPYFVNNYLKGQEPMAFDLLFWNADSTRMAAANHAFYLRNCYLKNALTKGEMVLDGQAVSLRSVRIPIYNLATREDHIAPAKSVFLGSQFFGGKVDFVLAGSGHIAGVVNPPDKKKYQYWTGGPAKGEYEDWLVSAEEAAGSWWPHWQAWIEAKDGKRVPARKPGGDALNALEEAPGSYVLEKA